MGAPAARSKLRVSGRAGVGNDVADIAHPGEEHEQALEPEPEPAPSPEAFAPAAAPAPVQAAPAAPVKKQADWFDEALADLDPFGVPKAAAAPVAPAPSAPPAHPPLQDNIGLDKPQPTVIGRYSAGGTDYVMYSDGSIEAENESGVLRFPSMAALKDFIEKKS